MAFCSNMSSDKLLWKYCTRYIEPK